MAVEDIAHGNIRITLSDAEAIRGVKRTEQAVKRGLKRIEKEKALVTIEADIKKADAKVKQFQRQLERLKGNKAELPIGTDTTEFDKAIAKVERRVTQLKGRRAALEISADAHRREIASALEINKLEERRIKLVERGESAEARRQMVMDRAQSKNDRDRSNELRHISALQKQYDKAYAAYQKLNQTGGFKNAVSPATRQRVEIDKRSALGEMTALRAQLEAMGAEPVEIEVNVKGSQALERLMAIGDVGMRLGPFTGTLAQFSKAALILGPILTGLIGTVGALAGVMGTGLAGSVGLASAAGVGAIGVFGGLFAAVKPLGTEIGTISKAWKAYEAQVQKTGSNSDKAKNKLKEFNSVTQHMSAESREGYKSLAGLNDEWIKLTKPTRTIALDVIGESVTGLTKMMPLLARRTNEAGKAVGSGLKDWIRGLSSVEGQNVIGSIMGRTNDSIKPLMSGLGQLSATFGRVAASFARYFRPLAVQFDAWATGLNKAASNTENLDAGVDRVMGTVKSFGRVLSGAFNVLKEFSSASIGPGGKLLDDLAGGLNDIAATIDRDPDKLSKFFSESIETTQAFYNVLKPLAQLFLDLSTILRPMTNVILGVLGPLTDFTRLLTSSAPGQLLITALAGSWLLRRGTAATITLIAGAINGLAAALTRAGAAGGAAALGGIAANLTRAKGAAAVPAVLGPAAAPVAGPMRPGIAAKAGRGVNALTTGLIGVSAPMAALAAAAGGAAYGISKLKDAADKRTQIEERTERVLGPEARTTVKTSGEGGGERGKGFGDRGGGSYQTISDDAVKAADSIIKVNDLLARSGAKQRELAAAHSTVTNSQLATESAEKAYAAAVKATGKNSLEARSALQQLTDARRYESEAVQNWKLLTADAGRAVRRSISDAQQAWNDGRGKPGQDALRDRLLRARDALAAFRLNAERAKSGLDAFVGRGSEVIGRFARTFAEIPNVKRLLVTVQTQEQGLKLADLSSKLNAMGREKTVAKILADSKTAEEAIRRLTNMINVYDRREATADLKTDISVAESRLEKIKARLSTYGSGVHTASLRTEKEQAETQIAWMKKELRHLDGTKVSPEVTVKLAVEDIVSGVTSSIGGGLGGEGDGWGLSGASRKAAKSYASKNKDKLAGMADFGGGTLGSMEAGGSGLNAFNGLAGRFGVRVGSGFRPGSITSSGNLSYHAQGRARDFPGPPESMMAFAKFLARGFGSRLKELIYTPLGYSIKNGRKVAPYAQAQHYDHVHVAMAKGGKVGGNAPGDTPRSGRYTQPTVLFAEEPNRAEYFISTNPRDRRRSQMLVAQAAAEVGMLEHSPLFNVATFATGARNGGAGYTVNTKAPNKHQQAMIRTAMQVAKSLRASPKATKALIMALIHESEATNLKGGDSTSQGPLQVLASTAKGMGISARDPEAVFRAFLTKGFTGKGSAMKLAQNKKLSAAQVATMVQGNATGVGVYARHGGEAAAAMNNWNMGRGGGAKESGEVATLGALSRITDRIAAKEAALEVATRSSDPMNVVRAITGTPATTRKLTDNEQKSIRKQLTYMERNPSGSIGDEYNAIAEQLKTNRKPVAATPGLMDELLTKDRVDARRQVKIDKALRGKLTKTTRSRLLEEKATLITERNSNKTKRVELRKQADEAKFEAGMGAGNRQGVDLGNALAAGTTGLQDDYMVANTERTYYENLRAMREKRGDKAGVTEAISAYNAANDRMRQISQQIETDKLGASAAVAGLTVTLSDDIAASRLAEEYWEAQLNGARQTNDNAAITTAANNLKSATDQTKALTRQVATDQMAARDAMASLSPQLDDDLSAAREAEGYWLAQLEIAQRIGDSAGVASAGQSLKSARESIETINTQMAMTPLNLASAAASLTNDLTDDVAAAQDLVNFWASAYNSMTGQKRIEAGQALASAKGSLKDSVRTAELLPLERDRALAALTEDTKDDEAATITLRDYWKKRLDQSQSEGDVQGTIEAANTLKGLNEEVTNNAESVQSQLIVLSEARRDLFKNFGSNFLQSAPVMPVGTHVGGPAVPNNYVPQQQGKVVNVKVNNTFQEPPADPHTWSQGVAWELQAAV